MKENHPNQRFLFKSMAEGSPGIRAMPNFPQISIESDELRDLQNGRKNTSAVYPAAEMLVDPEQSLENYKIYRTWVHNDAKLAYNRFADWFLWENTQGVRRAIFIAERLGQLLAYSFIALGAWLLFKGNFSGGFGMALIGLLMKPMKE